MASTLYVRTTPELRAAVVAEAQANRRKVNAQVELMIEQWLEEHATPRKEDKAITQAT